MKSFANDTTNRSNCLKRIFSIAAIATFVIGCASAQDMKPAAGAKDCAPPPGEGELVQFRTAALVGYTGWLYDGCAKDLKGEQFDTSDGRVTPFGLVVGAGKVIKGWDEGLVGMKTGGKRLLVIPPDKAYGDKSPTPKIPPNSTLVFEVSIIKILSGPPPAAAPK
jgi:FKBP-type peptidyl-prolyl cis-trans isomerase FkpA